MQLLRITSVPMKYQLVTEPARLEMTRDKNTGYVMEKTGGTFDIRAQNTRVRIDSTEFWNDLGYKTRGAALDQWVGEAKQAGREATARYVDFGNQVDQIQKGASIPDILFSRMMQDKSTNLTMVPLSPIQMDWIPPQLDVKYQPVQQTFDWRTAKNTMEFIPGKFSMNITQYPEVHIEYLGRPNYVPPSADPEYQGSA